jgi:hypothetical protein
VIEIAPFLMVVAIVAIVSFTRLQRDRMGLPSGRRRDRRNAIAQQDDPEADRLRGEVRQLKDRIAVLERIVTDGNHNRSVALEREIEALRHDKEIR